MNMAKSRDIRGKIPSPKVLCNLGEYKKNNFGVSKKVEL